MANPNAKLPSPGRPKGAKNKVTQELKEMILQSLAEAGGMEYLLARANDPKTHGAYLSLIGKVLPMAVTGADGGPVVVEIVQFGGK